MSDTGLTTSERTALETNERIISEGRETFVKVGNALAEIQDGKLYRADFPTFESYCANKWNIDKRHAYRLIAAAAVVGNVTHGSQTTAGESVTNWSQAKPDTERQARPLASLPKDEQPAAWKEAVETAPKDKKTGKPKVTAAHVEKVVAKRKAPVEVQPDPSPLANLPVRIRDAFANALTGHDAALNLLNQVAAKLAPLWGNDKDKKPMHGGEMLAGRRQIINQYLKNTRSEIANHRPYAVCPYCMGVKKSTVCSGCKGLGWVAKSTYEAAPADLRHSVEDTVNAA